MRSIKEKLGDEVDLVILLPGDQDRRIASIRWPNDDPENRAKVFAWDKVDPQIKKSLLESKTITSLPESGTPSIIIEPIETHGTAIGCLKISRVQYPFSQMSIRQINAIANLVSPAVQSYRELAALDLLSIRFAEKQADEKIYSPVEAIGIIADILHTVFSPFVTRLTLNFGFQTLAPIYRGDNQAIQFLKEKSTT